jgi:hypothetical protein
MSDTLDPEYIKKACDAIDWRQVPTNEEEKQNIMIALLVQINLQLSRLSNLLMIATGVNNIEDEHGNNEKMSDIAENDVGNTAENINKSVEEALEKNVVCGMCGQGVLPDKLGYCPNCKNDLKQQIALEIINKPQK